MEDEEESYEDRALGDRGEEDQDEGEEDLFEENMSESDEGAVDSVVESGEEEASHRQDRFDGGGTAADSDHPEPTDRFPVPSDEISAHCHGRDPEEPAHLPHSPSAGSVLDEDTVRPGPRRGRSGSKRSHQARSLQRGSVSPVVATSEGSPTRSATSGGGWMHMLERPANVAPKSREEAERHMREYEAMQRQFEQKALREQRAEAIKSQQQLEKERRLQALKRQWVDEVFPNEARYRGTRRLVELASRGIPPAVRGRAWCLGFRNELNITEELYAILKAKARDSAAKAGSPRTDHGGSKESTLSIIPLDLPRTFPCLSFFQAGGPLHESMRDVLAAFTVYRPDIGYVQGMSFLAAMLLLNMDAASAFTCLANILNARHMMLLYRLQLNDMRRSFAVYETLLAEHAPRVYRHLQAVEVSPDFYLVDWFLTIFCKSLPLELTALIWDMFAFEGEVVLFRVAVSLALYYQNTLEKEPFDVCLELLTHIPSDIDDARFFQIFHAVRISRVVFDQLSDQNKV